MSEEIHDQKPSLGKRIGRSSLILFVNLLLMVGIVCAVSFWLAPDFLHKVTGHDERVTVPVVENMDVEEAMEVLQERGLVPMIIDTLYSDGHAPGSVLDQLPEGNLPVKPGRFVYLTINSYTTQTFAFPDVIQHSSRQARAVLDDQFFVVDSIRYEPYEFDDLVLQVLASDGKEKGKDMKIGTLYPKRTRVTLVVGSTHVEVEAKNEESETSFFE